MITIYKIANMILLGVVFLAFALPVFALTPKEPTPLPTPTPTRVDYFLAYPGILPGHFLYPIKMIRDRILLYSTRNPLKKAELLLLYADKRLGAGKALIEGGKEKLGATTITKAEKYLERAKIQAQVAEKAGKDTAVFWEKLERAARKHEEILRELIEKTSGETKTTLEQLLEYPRQISK